MAQEEIFGPVLCAIPADDPEHAISLANDSIYGLSGAVFTEDSEAAFAIARRLRTGSVAQNLGVSPVPLPFGGFRQSGVGREGGGAEGFRPYVELKSVSTISNA